MTLSSFYPVICTDRVGATRDFYVRHLGFEVTFDAGWYVSLRRTDTDAELALVDASHPTIPDGYRATAAGLILNFEVDDVEAEYHRLVEQVGLAGFAQQFAPGAAVTRSTEDPWAS